MAKSQLVENSQSANSVQVSDYVYIGACSLLFLVGFLGNAVIVTIVAKNRHLRTPMNLFLMNLAIGDFFVILLCLPVTALENIAQVWYGGVFTCKLVKFLQNASVLASVMWLTALAVERRRMITKSARNFTVIERAVATKRCYLTCTLIWITAFVMALPMPLILDLEIRGERTLCDYIQNLALVAKIYEYFLFGIMICLPVVVIGIMQCNVAAVLLRHSNPAILINNELQSTRIATETYSYGNSIVNGLHLPPPLTNQSHQSSKVRFSDHPINVNVNQASLTSHNVTVNGSQSLSLSAWKRTANILIFLVFMLALSYLPLCIVTFIYSLVEGDGAVAVDYDTNNNTSLESEDFEQRIENAQDSAVDFEWKPYFLFSHFIFYVSPSLNPLVFYILSRRLRASIKASCRCVISRFESCKQCCSKQYTANEVEAAQDGIYHHELDSFLEAIRTHVSAGSRRRSLWRWFRRRPQTDSHDVTQRFVFMLVNRQQA